MTYPRSTHWIRPPGYVVGHGGSGPDPAVPTCPICGGHGGGGHGGGCPNHGMDPSVWLVEAKPGDPHFLPPPQGTGYGWTVAVTEGGGNTESPLIPEIDYNTAAARVAEATDEVLRWAATNDDGGVSNQLLAEIEETAETLACQGARLRVVARWMARTNAARLRALAEDWDRQAIWQLEHGEGKLAKVLHDHAKQLLTVLEGG